MNKRFLYYLFGGMNVLLICCLSLAAIFSFKSRPNETGTLKIRFINTANGKIITLRDSLYTNAFGEQYSISKLKYYIGQVSIPGSHSLAESDPYHLINAMNADNEFQIQMKPGAYENIGFLLGVDSASNCSGAQAGALDPMNDMFWTWNSGYVMFKLEGTSASSTADLQRIEHHVGGYKGNNNVATKINLHVPLQIKANNTTELVIETNMDHYWKGNADIKISELALIMTPGELSIKIASNFSGLFSVKSTREAP
jgi:hypothetical protein